MNDCRITHGPELADELVKALAQRDEFQRRLTRAKELTARMSNARTRDEFVELAEVLKAIAEGRDMESPAAILDDFEAMLQNAPLERRARAMALLAQHRQRLGLART